MNDDARKTALLISTTILSARFLKEELEDHHRDRNSFRLAGKLEGAVHSAYRRSKQILELIEKEFSDDEKYGPGAWDYNSERDGPKPAKVELEELSLMSKSIRMIYT